MKIIKTIVLCFFCLLSVFSSCSEEDIRSAIFSEFNQRQKADGFRMLRMFVLCPDKFEGYFLQYGGFRKFSLDEAREHFIKNHFGLLNHLNNESRITDSFYHFPLQPKDISLLYIYFEAEGKSAQYPYVEMVEIDGSNIKYTFVHNSDIQETKVESYDEAYQKVYGRPARAQ